MFMRPIGSSFEQESIPVGCVPSAAVAVWWGGGSGDGGKGVCPGGCLPPLGILNCYLGGPSHGIMTQNCTQNRWG